MLNELYGIRLLIDNIYVVYDKQYTYEQTVFRGTLEEVNAWLSLKEKGFNIPMS